MHVTCRAHDESYDGLRMLQDKALIGARREAAQHLQRVREGDDAVTKLEGDTHSMRDQVALAKAELDR